MKEEHPFRTPSEELVALTKEIAGVRLVLRDLAQRLNQIERYARRAFGGKTSTAAESPDPGLRQPGPPGALSREHALPLFDELVATSRSQGPATAEARLQSLDLRDLRLLAGEIGLPTGKKPPRRALIGSILRRVRESLMLSRNTNVTDPSSTTGLNRKPGD
jgi:hypothetical protein